MLFPGAVLVEIEYLCPYFPKEFTPDSHIRDKRENWMLQSVALCSWTSHLSERSLSGHPDNDLSLKAHARVEQGVPEIHA